MMNLKQYIAFTRTTAVYPEENASFYLNGGLLGEAGELIGKVSKLFRGDKSYDEMKHSMIAELGDILWFAARHLDTFGGNYTEEDFDLDAFTANEEKKLTPYRYRNPGKKQLFNYSVDLADAVFDLVRVHQYWEDEGDELMQNYIDTFEIIRHFAYVNHVSVEELIDVNVAKLSSRKERGTLKGDGDNR